MWIFPSFNSDFAISENFVLVDPKNVPSMRSKSRVACAQRSITTLCFRDSVPEDRRCRSATLGGGSRDISDSVEYAVCG